MSPGFAQGLPWFSQPIAKQSTQSRLSTSSQTLYSPVLPNRRRPAPRILSVTRIIIVNDHEMSAMGWHEAGLPAGGDDPPPPPHARNREVLESGVSDLRPGEACFRCDQNLAFDTTFTLKGDGRKFVVISSRDGVIVAKPY